MIATIENNILYLSPTYLTSFGILANTLKVWRYRGVGEWIEKPDGLLIAYKSIPSATKKKANLPSEDHLKRQLLKQDLYTKVYDALNHARLFEFAKYKSIYETDGSLPTEKVTKFAQLHAVFQAIIELKEKEAFRDLKVLHEAFNKLYPGKYRIKNALSNAIRKAMADGIMSVALDKRAFGNNTEQTSKKFTALQKFWMANMAGHPAKFSNSQIHKKICAACIETGNHSPSLSWVKAWRRKLLKNPVLFESRYGQQEANKMMPFAKLINAAYANDQWQLDGFKMPFFYKGEKKGFQTLVMVRLVDNYSGKIVGCSIGKTESSILIMDAIRDAINSTQVIPFEILTDCHVFNETMEAKNLIGLLSKRGSQWIPSPNPQRKAIIERYNQHLDRLCREYWGYVGQGVKSKSREALAKPELMDKYVKNWLAQEEIKGIGISVVEKFNNTVNVTTGKTPNELYAENQNPNTITADIYTRAELLTNEASPKVIRSQITITKEGKKYEYVLPSEFYQKYNGEEVIVRYENLNEGVYLFDKETGKPITTLHLKQAINGATINQTDEDKNRLNRGKGHRVGIVVKGKKKLEKLSDDAHQLDPDAHARINRLSAPKSLVKELEESATLRYRAEDQGLQIALLDTAEKVWTTGTTALQQKPKKRTNLFKPENHEVKPAKTRPDYEEN